MPPSTGISIDKSKRNSTTPSLLSRIGRDDWVAVDACQLLVPISKLADCYRSLQRPLPRPPRAAVFAKLDRWWSRCKFSSTNVVVLCFDGRVNPLKRRRVPSENARSAAAETAALLQLAGCATASTEAFAQNSPEDWKELRKSLDRARHDSAHYDIVLYALVKEWVLARGYEAHVLTVCAPFEADAQMVSLQQQGLVDKILSEDSDIAHLGANGGTVLSFYIAWKDFHRYARLQLDSAECPRALRAAVLGTDYNHNHGLVTSWDSAVEVTKTIMRELDGREYLRLPNLSSVQSLCTSKATRCPKDPSTPQEWASMLVDSALMFEHGPVSKLQFAPEVATRAKKRECFLAGQYLVDVVPFHPITATKPRTLAWFNQYFRTVGNEAPFFKFTRWSRTGAAIEVPVYDFAKYANHHANGSDAADLPNYDLATPLPYAAFLPYIPELCTDKQLVDWCKVHSITIRSSTQRHGQQHAHGVWEKGLIGIVKDVLQTPLQSRRLPLSRAFVLARGLADPEPFDVGGDAVPDTVAVIHALSLSDELLFRSLCRLRLEVANDQRNKALRYVKGGHLNLNSLRIQAQKDADGHRLMLCHMEVVASRRQDVYNTRVCLKVDEQGRACEWLPPPHSQCGCVIHLYVCAHQMAVLCGLAYIASVVGRLQTALPGATVSLQDVQAHFPQPVIPRSQMASLLGHMFSPAASRVHQSTSQRLEVATEEAGAIAEEPCLAPELHGDRHHAAAAENDDEDEDEWLIAAAEENGFRDGEAHASIREGYSGGDAPWRAFLMQSTRTVDGEGNRDEPVAMIAEIQSWAYGTVGGQAAGDDVGQLSQENIRKAVDGDIAQKANLTSFSMPGYDGEGTERQWHAVFGEQILHHMAVGNLPDKRCGRSHYLGTVREEISSIVDEWNGAALEPLPVATTPTWTLTWHGTGDYLVDRWHIMASKEAGILAEGVVVIRTSRGCFASYQDRSNPCNAVIELPSNRRCQAYLHPVAVEGRHRWKLARHLCTATLCVWTRKGIFVRWRRNNESSEPSVETSRLHSQRARRISTEMATVARVLEG